MAQDRLDDLIADGIAGLSEVIGSWKIIASRLPRRSRRVALGLSKQLEAVEATRPGDPGGVL